MAEVNCRGPAPVRSFRNTPNFLPPFLIHNFHLALGVAMVVVLVELAIITSGTLVPIGLPRTTGFGQFRH
jgi:hypothetical protein